MAEAATQCNICLDVKVCSSLPCCNGPVYCMSCLDLIVKDLLQFDDDEEEGDETSEEMEKQDDEQAVVEKYGDCPTCEKIFVKKGDNLSRPTGRCYMCGHGGKILAAVRSFTLGNDIVLHGLCDNCWICEAYPETYQFEYECQRCGNYQTIPHPMYRYQAKVDAFGGATWACHQQCLDYTNWRIKADLACKVPAVERPATWDE